MGGVVGYNLLWSVLSLPWIGGAYVLVRLGFALGGVFLPGAVILACALLFSSPATALLFAVSAAWAHGQDLGTRALLDVGRTLFWRALVLGLIIVAGTALVLVNLVFYQQLAGWLGALLSGLMIWFLLLLGLVAVYIFPVLVSQGGSVWTTLRQSFLLAVDNLKLSLVLLLVSVVATGLGLASGLGVFCGVLSAVALYISTSFRALLPKYTGEALSVEKPRRLRELIRPWEA